MDIKRLKPTIGGQFKQGYFSPSNPSKYIGNPHTIIYRSSWEYDFFIECDTNPKIIRWVSEPKEISVRYKHPSKKNNDGTPKECSYFPDVYFELNTSKGLNRIVGEIKPKNKLIEPSKIDLSRSTLDQVTKYKKKMIAYMVIMIKARAAIEFCASKNMKYMFITEDIINKLKKR